MSVVDQGRIGEMPGSDAGIQPISLTKQGALKVGDRHARYYEAVYRGNVFWASPGSQALTVNGSGAMTGLALTNPSGSGKNFVILDAAVALASAPAGISTLVIGLHSTPIATHTTPIPGQPINALIVNSAPKGASQALVDSAWTPPATATVIRGVGGGPVATGSVTSPFMRDEVAGLITLGPGTSIVILCLTTAITIVPTLYWEEVPI